VYSFDLNDGFVHPPRPPPRPLRGAYPPLKLDMDDIMLLVEGQKLGTKREASSDRLIKEGVLSNAALSR
jgi:hypothetical protein